LKGRVGQKFAVVVLICFTGIFSTPVRIQEYLETKISDTTLAGNYFARAKALYDSAKFHHSIIYFEKAAKLYADHAIWGRHIGSKNNLGDALIHIGEYDSAIIILEDALQTSIDHFGEISIFAARSYNLLGVAYRNLGEYDLAMKIHNEALRILGTPPIDDPYEVALTHLNIGYTYYMSEDKAVALTYYFKSLEIIKTKYGEDHILAAQLYNNIANCHLSKEYPDLVTEYHQKALKIWLENFGEIHPKTARSYRNFGVHFRNLEEWDTSLVLHQKGLNIFIELYGPKHAEVSHSYQLLGEYYEYRKQYLKAVECKKQSIVANIKDTHFNNIDIHDLNEFSAIAECDFYDPVRVMHQLNFSANDLEKLFHQTKDIGYLHTALNLRIVSNLITERIRISHQTNSDKIWLANRMSASKIWGVQFCYLLHQHYAQQFNYSEADKYLHQAFQFSEKAKSVVLLESLFESQARNYSYIPDNLLHEESELKDEITDYNNLLNLEKLKKEDADSKKVLQYERKLFALNRDHQKLIQHFQETYPNYNQLKYQVTLDAVDSIMTRLRSNEVLIEYVVSDNSLFIFTITHEDISWEKVSIDAEFPKQLQSYLQSIKKIDTEDFVTYSHKFYDYLIKPVQHKIENKDKLIIIPDGMLNYLPFETLISRKPVQGEKTDFSNLDYLINDHSIAYHFSSTLWLNNKRNFEQHFKTNNFVGFAPVFHGDSTNGYILAHNKPFVDTANNNVLARSVSLDGNQFNPLPHSETEVDSIFSLFKDSGRDAKAYFHREATEANFKNECEHFNIVHVASHAFYNSSNPELSGVAFSQSRVLDQKSEHTTSFTSRSDTVENDQVHDDILYIGEAYNLELDANLLVLSACESGIGEYIRGEGVMSMTRGFLYAGAKNIVISLWRVDDKDSKDLMVDMYRHYLAGESISASLRMAKLKMIKRRQTSFPMFWSGFVLVGD